MTDVLNFPTRSCVIIYSGLVKESRLEHATGVEITRYDPPRMMFFLDFVEADGRLGVWHGDSYANALAAARDWVAEGVEIRDQTSVTWGRS